MGALSVAENVYAGRQPTNALRRHPAGPDDRGHAARSWPISRSTSTRGRRSAPLSPGQQQMVEIAKGLSHELKLLILDEPTSSLTINEGRHLFRVIRRLAAQGVAIVYVSHRMAEIFEISDRVTVLKDGRVTGVRETDAVTHDELIALMVGRELSFEPDPRRAPPDAAGRSRGQRPGRRSRSLRLVLAALRRDRVPRRPRSAPGAPRSCEAIFGARPIQSGSVARRRPRAAARAAPSDSMAAGISMLPEDRKEGGLFIDFTIAANVVAANLRAYTHARPAVADAEMRRGQPSTMSRSCASPRPASSARCATCRAATSRRCCSPSGWRASPRILIVDEPTRGVDVGSKADIYRILRDLAASGMALLVVSSDLPEVLALAHRIVVMSEGRVAGELDAADGNRDRHSRARRAQSPELTARSSMSSDVAPAGAMAAARPAASRWARRDVASAERLLLPHRHGPAAAAHRAHRRSLIVADDHPRARRPSRARRTRPSSSSTPRRPASWRAG